ncbi:hypothetical protein D3C76_1875620 [compost metagenome]
MLIAFSISSTLISLLVLMFMFSTCSFLPCSVLLVVVFWIERSNPPGGTAVGPFGLMLALD